MIKAFVFGKFAPFHKGHEAMIRFALHHCDFLSVLVCCSDKEIIPANVRKSWIEASFTDTPNIEVRILNYSESELPNTSKTSYEVAAKWSEVFQQLYPDFSLVITSEPYGDIVAALMNIRHLAFDVDRKKFPVSATAVRADSISNWKFLPDAVKPYYAIKVVILGTESTGKTMMTEKLATHYGCTSVSEAGRDLIPSSKTFTFKDLEAVAAAHADRISKAMRGDHPLIIIDTNIYITLSYAQFAFSKILDVTDDVYKINSAELYLYLRNDVPYVQDGTRLSKNQRNMLDVFHRRILADHKIEVNEISGSWHERFIQAVVLIDKLVIGKSGNQ